MYQDISSSIFESGSPNGSPNRGHQIESIVLTDKSLRSLQGGRTRRIVWARGLSGFGIRVTPRGTKSFVFKYYIEGRVRWITFGRYPKMKLAEALQKYGETIEKLQAGEDPAEENIRANRLDRASPTVRELAGEYIEKYAKPRKRSWQEDRRILDKYVVPVIGTKKASKVTRREIIALLDDIVASGSPIQANRTLAVVRRMFNFGVDRVVIDASPCHRMKPPSPEGVKNRYLNFDEMKVVWHGIDHAPITPQTRQALKLLFVTLQRSSEVLGLHRSEINVKDRVWIIPGDRTKNKHSHLVPLSPLAFGIISDRLKVVNNKGFLFPGEGRGDHLTKSALSRAVARNLDHFGVEKFTPHDFRRTGSTQLAGFKVPRFDRDRVLNHTDQTIGAIYDVHEYEDEKRAALTLWSDVVSAVAGSSRSINTKKLRASFRYRDYFAD